MSWIFEMSLSVREPLHSAHQPYIVVAAQNIVSLEHVCWVRKGYLLGS